MAFSNKLLTKEDVERCGVSGGSAGGFYVVNLNFEYNEETDTETVTADKTFQDIVNAADAGLFPVAIFVSKHPDAGNFAFNVYNMTYMESSSVIYFEKHVGVAFSPEISELCIFNSRVECSHRNEWKSVYEEYGIKDVTKY